MAQAQLIEKEQQMHEELWAVFDMDGHSHHQQAYERAEKEMLWPCQIGIVLSARVCLGFTFRKQ